MIVVIENAGRAVACDENIRPAVIIKVKRRHAESVVAVCPVDLRLLSHVRKLAIAIVVVQHVIPPRQSARPAHHRNTLPHTRRPLTRARSRFDVKVHVGRYQ